MTASGSRARPGAGGVARIAAAALLVPALAACGATARPEVYVPPRVESPTSSSEALAGTRLEPEPGERRRRGTGSLAATAEKKARERRPARAVTLLPVGTGRFGSGLVLGAMEPVTAPIGGPAAGRVRVSVANIPNRTSAAGFAASLGRLVSRGQDVVLLNEVSGRDLGTMRALAPGYDAYRDPVPDRSLGGSQSMNNVVLWRTDRWNLVDAGRVKVVDDDRGYRRGRPFVWDRYVTWALLQRRSTGAIVSVVSTHMPTNPAKYPAQPGSAAVSRLTRYAVGMDRVVAVVSVLSRFGPVLLGGDMNSHPHQGTWTAAARMQAQGFGYAKDSGVMYLFHPPGSAVLAHRQVRIASDHPALLATVDMRGTAPPA